MTGGLDDFYRFLESIADRGVRPGLERIAKAFDYLDHPERKIPVIHVAGTNGKGSSSTLVTQLLAKNGYRVGLSLSPHVRDWRERIQFWDKNTAGGAFISEADLVSVHAALRDKIPDDLGLTYFEWSIALAVTAFARFGCDFMVLETGMGGRWDATNICPAIVSGVTTVGLDHMAQLGATREAICGEKIRIAKPGADFLFGPDDPDLIALAKRHCKDVGATFHSVADADPVLRAAVSGHPFFTKRPSYYRDNMLFALGLGRLVARRGFRVSFDSFLAQTEFALPPARCEKISDQPVIYLDGAHNEPALAALKSYALSHWGDDYDLVFGCLGDRDMPHLAGIIASPKGANYWVRFDGGARASSEMAYHETERRYGGLIMNCDVSLRDRLSHSRKTVLVCGSFYLCAQFRDFWNGRATL